MIEIGYMMKNQKSNKQNQPTKQLLWSWCLYNHTLPRKMNLIFLVSIETCFVSKYMVNFGESSFGAENKVVFGLVIFYQILKWLHQLAS